jgi:secreted Zn-dependent insulinase-like peptidase
VHLCGEKCMLGRHRRTIVIILSALFSVVTGLRLGAPLRKFAASRMKPSIRASYGTNAVQIPKVDDRVFFQHMLRNGIPVTLVQDKKSEKCSCALSVKTGAMYDPQPGVAHITEHAVFLGSEKYPVENAYKDFLNKHGGGSNAGTSMDQTTYKFNVNSNAFDEALDVFSQFFKGPLFRTEAMCREILAVDSEDSKNRILDSRRLLQVLKHQVHPDSLYSKFSTGNLKTLIYGDEVMYGQHLADIIRAFHHRYYHPTAMAVALVGPQSVDELRDMAERHFADIAGFSAYEEATELAAEPVTARSASLFIHGGGKLIRLRPVKDLRDMTVIWELPASHEMYRNNPCYLLSYLLANKGEGSWFAALQDRQWATSTAAGVRTHFTDFTLFDATVSLTEKGMENWHEVLALLYRSVEALAHATDAELAQYWQEMRTIYSLDFHYMEKTTAYELAPQLSSNMLDYPAQHIVSAGRLVDDHVEIPLVRAFLAKLASDKSLVFLRCKNFAEAPLNLSSDDASYLHEHAFPEYEAYVRSGGAGGSAAGSSDVDTGDDVYTEDSITALNTSSASTIEAAIEASKLSGEYFRNLRGYQDALYHAAAATAAEGLLRTEPFYGVPYHITDLATAQLQAGTGQSSIADVKITLPPPNRFLCTELIDGTHILEEDRSRNGVCSTRREGEDCAVSETEPGSGETPLVELPQELDAATRPRHSAPPVPVRGAGTPRERAWVWHSQDQVFRQPRAIFFHRVESPACGKFRYRGVVQIVLACTNQLPLFDCAQRTGTRC